jgi:hypothetical protein
MSFSFGRPSCELALCCVWAPNLRTCLASRWGAQLADVPCIALQTYVGARNLRTCLALRWRPTCGQALGCVWAPILWTCLALQAVLKSLPPSQNLFLSILQLVFYPSAPLCGRFRCGSVFRLGAHLADVPCVAFGRPSCGRASRGHPTWVRPY